MKKIVFSIMCFFSIPACATELMASEHVEQMEQQMKEIDNNEQIIINQMENEANSGNITSQVNLGLAYLNGRVTGTPDPNKAFELFKKAADKNNGDAMLQIGLMFLNGNGVDKNEQLGRVWIQKASDNNSAMAQLFIASKLRIDSHKYFEMSANNGNLFAMVTTSLDYMNGMGVQADNSKAYYWGYMAKLLNVEHANPNFVKQIDFIGTKITNAEDIQKKAADFLNEHKYH